MIRSALTGLLFSAAGAWAQTVADSTATMPRPEPIHMGWLLAKATLTLLLIIGLIFATVYLLRKYVYRGYSGSGSAEGLRILSQIQIQPKKFIALLQVYNRLLIVGISDASMHTLTEFRDPEEVRAILEQVHKPTEAWGQHKFIEFFKKSMQNRNS